MTSGLRKERVDEEQEPAPSSRVRRKAVTFEEAMERILWAIAALPPEDEWDEYEPHKRPPKNLRSR